MEAWRKLATRVGPRDAGAQQEVYSRFPKAKICAAAATGYGEDIIKNFLPESGEVYEEELEVPVGLVLESPVLQGAVADEGEE